MTGENSHSRNRASSRGELRFDAAQNRERMLHAARSIFVEIGLDAPLTAVAKQAGVGTATLYRRFPTREALLAAVLEEQLERYADLTAAALTDPDPARGIRDLVRRLCVERASDRDLALALNSRTHLNDAFERTRSKVERQLDALIERGQAAGVVPPDAHWTDIGVLLAANDGVRRALDRDAAEKASERLAAVFLRALLVEPDEKN